MNALFVTVLLICIVSSSANGSIPATNSSLPEPDVIKSADGLCYCLAPIPSPSPSTSPPVSPSASPSPAEEEAEPVIDEPQTLPTNNPFPSPDVPLAAPVAPSPSPSCNAAAKKTAAADLFRYKEVTVFKHRCELNCAAGPCRYCRRAPPVRRCSWTWRGRVCAASVMPWGGCYSHSRSVGIDAFYRRHGGRVAFSEADAAGWHDDRY